MKIILALLKVSSIFESTNKKTTMKNTEKIQVELVGENNLKNTIEKRLKKSVMFFSDSDGANLLFTATVNGCSVARVYKSFDEHYNAITIIRYNNEAL